MQIAPSSGRSVWGLSWYDSCSLRNSAWFAFERLQWGQRICVDCVYRDQQLSVASGIRAGFIHGIFTSSKFKNALKVLQSNDPLSDLDSLLMNNNVQGGLIGSFGNNGTTADLAAINNVRPGFPLIGPISGMASLRVFTPSIINLRASTSDEIVTLAYYLNSMGLKSVSIINENTPHGLATITDFLKVVSSLHLTIASQSSFEPDSVSSIRSAVQFTLVANPPPQYVLFMYASAQP